MLKNSFEVIIILFSLIILFDSFCCDTLTTSKVLSVYHETTRRGAVRYMTIANQKIPTIASEIMKKKIGQNIELKITPLFHRLKSYQVAENKFKFSFSNTLGIVLSFVLLLMQLLSIRIQRVKDDTYDYKELVGRFRWYSSLIVIVIMIMVIGYAS